MVARGGAAGNLLRTVLAGAAGENDVEPRAIRSKGAKQALAAFAPKLEASRPEERAGLVDAMLLAVAYHPPLTVDPREGPASWV
jgi:hypothetical protein